METRIREDRLIEVVELLGRGAWQDAHVIVQQDTSIDAAWLHGIVHTLEGDLENAQHWYRKAKRPFPGADAVHTELSAARAFLNERRGRPIPWVGIDGPPHAVHDSGMRGPFSSREKRRPSCQRLRSWEPCRQALLTASRRISWSIAT